MSGKKKGFSLYLGDEEFLKKLTVYYSWFIPIILFLFSCVVLYDRSVVTGIFILILSIFNLPIIKKKLLKVSRVTRLLINVGLIILTVLSMIFIYKT